MCVILDHHTSKFPLRQQLQTVLIRLLHAHARVHVQRRQGDYIVDLVFCLLLCGNISEALQSLSIPLGDLSVLAF